MEWGSLGDILGGLGGCAGFLALYLNNKDRQERAKLERVPPELRDLLLDAVKVSEQVRRRPRDNEWCAQHVTPLRERLDAVEPAIKAAQLRATTESKVMVIDTSLISMEVSGLRTNSPVPEDEAARHAAMTRQREAATKCHEAATLLLQRLADHEL